MSPYRNRTGAAEAVRLFTGRPMFNTEKQEKLITNPRPFAPSPTRTQQARVKKRRYSQKESGAWGRSCAGFLLSQTFEARVLNNSKSGAIKSGIATLGRRSVLYQQRGGINAGTAYRHRTYTTGVKVPCATLTPKPFIDDTIIS